MWTAGSVGELLERVRSICRLWNPVESDPEEIWFRGQRKLGDPLLPALFRADQAKFHYDEASLFERFRVLAAPYVHGQSFDDWGWYFLARHHGLPSRLLDWSESLLVATFFAIDGHIRNRTRLDVDKVLAAPPEPAVYDADSPCVWLLDAGSLNQWSHSEDIVFVPGGARTIRYLPDSLAQADAGNARPIAILPPRTNERIAAQQGVFTLHGHETTPLDKLPVPSGKSGPRLAPIVLDRSRVCHIWEELQVLGVGPLAVFPELDRVASHVAWVSQSNT